MGAPHRRTALHCTALHCTGVCERRFAHSLTHCHSLTVTHCHSQSLSVTHSHSLTHWPALTLTLTSFVRSFVRSIVRFIRFDSLRFVRSFDCLFRSFPLDSSTLSIVQWVSLSVCVCVCVRLIDSLGVGCFVRRTQLKPHSTRARVITTHVVGRKRTYR